MNCATMTPDESCNYYRDHNNRDNGGGSERRTSRRLTCLRGESDEHYDYEAEGKDLVLLLLFFFTSPTIFIEPLFLFNLFL